MVTVVDYAVRENTDGENFIALILEGDIEMVQSQETGQYYATARKTSITSTFNQVTAESLVGKQLPGSITKESCHPYDYVVPDTGEVMELDYRYVYVPVEEAQLEPSKAKENGALAMV